MYTYEKNVMICCLREACLCYFFMLIFCLLKDLFYCSLFYWFILIFGHMMHWCICKLGTFINVISVMILVLLIKKWSVYYKNAFLSFITMQIARKISTNNKIKRYDAYKHTHLTTRILRKSYIETRSIFCTCPSMLSQPDMSCVCW